MFYVPSVYLPLFKKYFSQLEGGIKQNSSDRLLKNFNVKAGSRIQSTGKNTAGTCTKDSCAVMGMESEGYTTHCFRRSAATNLADAGMSLVNLKRHGQWKSDASAERYIANSILIREEREKLLVPVKRKKNHSLEVDCEPILEKDVVVIVSPANSDVAPKKKKSYPVNTYAKPKYNPYKKNVVNLVKNNSPSKPAAFSPSTTAKNTNIAKSVTGMANTPFLPPVSVRQFNMKTNEVLEAIILLWLVA